MCIVIIKFPLIEFILVKYDKPDYPDSFNILGNYLKYVYV